MIIVNPGLLCLSKHIVCECIIPTNIQSKVCLVSWRRFKPGIENNQAFVKFGRSVDLKNFQVRK